MLLLLAALGATTRISLDLTRPGHQVSPMLYGLMTEEINHSYDGGLYGELVRNRAFLDDPQQPVDWEAIGAGSSISLERSGPSPARPVALRVHGGVANKGYWGIPIRASTEYRLSLWVKADAPTAIEADIESADGARTYARTQFSGIGKSWRKVTATLTTERNIRATSDARLTLHIGNRTAWLCQASLFAPTYHSRPNGNRQDLMRLLIDMRPKFLRFPGGNYLEGNRPEDRFPWKATLGSIDDRPGHPCPWGYRSTDGMGLLEFLEWCEDMNAKPVLAVYAGYALDGKVTKAGPDLKPFVRDALDEIEYVTGGPKTTWGARRIRDGHPKPFPLAAVEIGNEDGFDRSGSYPARFTQFYDAVKAQYPRLKVISTTGSKDWLGQRNPDLVDEHYYASTWDLMALASRYDKYDRKGPKVFVGEWASHDGPNPWEDVAHNGPTPDMSCAVADAAFLTGIERNSDIVTMSCYAPLFVNVNPGARQWAVNLIGYDALTSFGSPSYYAQRMFSQELGNRTVPLILSGAPEQSQNGHSLPGLFASATTDTNLGTLYLKLVNATTAAQRVSFDVNGESIAPRGTMTVLSGDPKATNTIADPRHVVPVRKAVTGLGRSFEETLPPNSVTVLELRRAGEKR